FPAPHGAARESLTRDIAGGKRLWTKRGRLSHRAPKAGPFGRSRVEAPRAIAVAGVAHPQCQEAKAEDREDRFAQRYRAAGAPPEIVPDSLKRSAHDEGCQSGPDPPHRCWPAADEAGLAIGGGDAAHQGFGERPEGGRAVLEAAEADQVPACHGD